MSSLNGKTHGFTLVLEGPDPSDSIHLDRLYEAGCADATFGARDGMFFANFDREAPSFADALTGAIAAVEATVPGLRVVRIEPEELVTAAEIALRTNRSRESVRQLFEGIRGNGGFPKPTAWLSDRTRLWHWTEVSRWFSARLGADVGSADEAQLVGLTNALLTVRRFVMNSGHGQGASARNKALFTRAWSNLGLWIADEPTDAPKKNRSDALKDFLARVF